MATWELPISSHQRLQCLPREACMPARLFLKCAYSSAQHVETSSTYWLAVTEDLRKVQRHCQRRFQFTSLGQEQAPLHYPLDPRSALYRVALLRPVLAPAFTNRRTWKRILAFTKHDRFFALHHFGSGKVS